MDKHALINTSAKVGAKVLGFVSCGFHCLSTLTKKGVYKLETVAGLEHSPCKCCCTQQGETCKTNTSNNVSSTQNPEPSAEENLKKNNHKPHN